MARGRQETAPPPERSQRRSDRSTALLLAKRPVYLSATRRLARDLIRDTVQALADLYYVLKPALDLWPNRRQAET